jgi:hypothetical protein
MYCSMPHHTKSLELHVELSEKRMNGTARLWVVLPRLSPEDKDYPKLRLNARMMSVEQVRVDGQVVEFDYPQPNDLLKVSHACTHSLLRTWRGMRTILSTLLSLA